jgi:hypothetical protein
VILGGTEIGHGAAVGAGAVITRSVAPYSIVGGVPARHLKFRMPADVVEKLVLLDWWNFDLASIPGVRDYSLVEQFIANFHAARRSDVMKSLDPPRRVFES